MKKRSIFTGAVATMLLAQGAAQFTTPAFAASEFTTRLTNISVDGNSFSNQQAFTYNNTTYMPIYYVMQVLKSYLHVTNTWNGSRWDINLPPSAPRLNLKPVVPGHSNTTVYLNGVLVQTVNTLTQRDPASHVLTTYMPIWYVMQILQAFSVQSTWDGSQWNLFTNVAKDELQAYETKHPQSRISFMKEVNMTLGAAPSLVVENQPTDEAESVMISVVSPNLTVTDFSTIADFPSLIKDVPQAGGDMAAAFAEAGAHTSLVYLFKSVNGVPTLVQQFSGDNGVDVWVQDGAVQVFTSNRTYNWDITLTNGQKDDSAINDVYQYQPGQVTSASFNQISEFRSGVFENDPGMSFNPEVEALSALDMFHSFGGPGSSATIQQAIHDLATGGDPVVYTTPQFIADCNAQVDALSFLNDVPATTAWSFNTVKSSSVNPNQLQIETNWGGHELVFTLQNVPTWTLTGLQVVETAN